MNRLILLAGAALCALPLPAHATDLVEVLAAASRHDPTIASAEAARDAGEESDAQARALKRPGVRFQAGYQYSSVESDSELPDDLDPYFSGQRNSGQVSAGVQLVQPLYDASRHAQSVQLHEKAAGARVKFAGEQQQLVLRVAQAYFAVLSAQDALSASERQVDAAEEQRRGAQARFDAGRARITDVRESEARRDASAVQVIAAQSDLAYAKAAFTELTGLSGDALDRPSADFRATQPTLPLDAAMAQAEAQAPGVVAAEHSARAAGADVDRYSLAGRPVLEGVAGYQGRYRLGGESGNGIVPDRVESASVGLRLSVPLYAGGGIASKEREATANAQKALRDLDAARRDARLQAQKAWYAQANGARRVAALGTASASAGLQQDAAGTGLEVGIRTQKDLLDAQGQTIASERDRLNAIYDYLQARLQLAAATGGLGEEDLIAVTRQMQGAPGA